MIVLDKDLTSPPGSPADGDAYLLYNTPDAGTKWEGHEGEIASYFAAGDYWRFFAPSPGWDVFCYDDSTTWIQTEKAAPWIWYQTTPTVIEPQTSFEFQMARGASSPVVGDAVYCSAASTVDKAKADSASTMPAVGLVTAIDGSLATVRVLGLCNGVLSGLSFGAYYYVSAVTAGALTTVKPASPPNIPQVFGVGLSASAILINPAAGSNA